MAMTNDQFDAFVADSVRLVQETAGALNSRYGIGDFNKWDLDQESATLVFSNDSKKRAVCSVAAIGSIAKGAWRWAWANSSILPPLSVESSKLKALAETTGMDIFSNESLVIDDDMPWELCGMALKELGGLGVYRCGTSEPSLFVIIKSVDIED